jgi:hypothetical protein
MEHGAKAETLELTRRGGQSGKTLENGCSLEDVQRAAGRWEPRTTKLFDRRGYNPEKSASYFATY